MVIFNLLGNKIVVSKVCAVGLPYVAHYKTSHVVVPVVFPGVIELYKFELLKGIEHDFELSIFGTQNTKWIALIDGSRFTGTIDSNLRIPLNETKAFDRFNPYLSALEKIISDNGNS